MVITMKMLRLLFILAVLGAVICSENKVEDSSDKVSAPEFCYGKPCPDFKVKKEYEGFELRMYEKLSWVSTTSKVTTEEYIASEKGNMIRKLFAYIGGENDKEEKVSMGVPVRSKVQLGSSTTSEHGFTRAIYLVDETPKPNDPSVTVETEQPTKFYVKSFEACGEIPLYMDKADELIADLVKEGLSFEANVFYMVGYDRPAPPEKKHQEVWVKAK